MNKTFIVLLLLSIVLSLSAQKTTVVSPNRKIIVELFNTQGSEKGEWFLKVKISDKSKTSEIIPQITLGLDRSDQNFSKELKFLKAGKTLLINEEYIAIHGKRSQCSNSATEMVVTFENPTKVRMNLILRAYNDGVAFVMSFQKSQGHL